MMLDGEVSAFLGPLRGYEVPITMPTPMVMVFQTQMRHVVKI